MFRVYLLIIQAVSPYLRFKLQLIAPADVRRGEEDESFDFIDFIENVRRNNSFDRLSSTPFHPLFPFNLPLSHTITLSMAIVNNELIPILLFYSSLQNIALFSNYRVGLYL